MKRILLLLTLATGALLVACTGDSKFPVATGKASISAINAIFASPTVNFVIEENLLGQIQYKEATGSQSFDDLNFTFNFDIFVVGANTPNRFASQNIDFVAGQHYTILAAGSIASPELTVWEWPEREFADTDTIFQARFAHTSNSLNTTAIDVYFALEGVAPVAGAEVATLNFGDISNPLDFEADNYVVTITTSGDPLDVIFTSKPAILLARSDLIITPFDGDANDVGPVVVRGFNAAGGAVAFQEVLGLSTLQFLHTSIDMGVSDIFDDEALTSQIQTGHAYQDLTTNILIAQGTPQFFYTPTGDTTMVSLETGISVVAGLRFRLIAFGSDGNYFGTTMALNHRSIDTAGKLLYFVASNNQDFTDLYLIDADAVLDEQLPFFPAALSNAANPALPVVPGSYDLYVTPFQEKEVLAGPFRLDVADGDVVDMVVFDTIDPAVMDIVVYPIP